uniref:DUF4806 domain-containing protein n=1 Tax=Photinus pyralis TaxID=7054 RepID=A0A1Y1L962_PHOPY
MPRRNLKPMQLLSSRQKRRRKASTINFFSPLPHPVCQSSLEAIDSFPGCLQNDSDSPDPVHRPVSCLAPSFEEETVHNLCQPSCSTTFCDNGEVIDLNLHDNFNNLGAGCAITSPTVIHTLSDDLRQWIVDSNISHENANRLLFILKRHGIQKLPTDVRSLLKTPRVIKTVSVPPGNYVHFGIKESLLHSLQKYYSTIAPPATIYLDFNIDGLPIAKSSTSQFWPILSAIAKTEFYCEPFVIGIYHGSNKPNDPNYFLKMFVEDLQELILSGISYKNINIKIAPHVFICDAPARAYITLVKNHTGYNSCPKCITEGEYYSNKVIFPETNQTLRTDETFKNKVDDEYHKGTSILELLSIGMVSQFCIDYMHCVCLGVTKKILKLLVNGNVSVRLPKPKLIEISARLNVLKKYICSEFCRKPRTLDELDRWKATEFRQILLYTGPVIFKEILTVDQYNHFLSFSIAIRIFCSNKQNLYLYAHKLLTYFVQNFELFYGLENITHNVHMLTHLFHDVKKVGPLDNFSAFKYESKLFKIKNKMQSSSKPLQQIYNRIVEEQKLIQPVISSYPYLENFLGISDSNEELFERIQFRNYMLSIKAPNNCCCIQDILFEIRSIKKTHNKIILLGVKYLNTQPFYFDPLNSLILGIGVVNDNNILPATYDISCVTKKCLKMPTALPNSYIIMPLIHL